MDGMFILALSWSFAASSKASSRKEFWTYKDRIVFGGTLKKMRTVRSQYSQSKAPRHLTWRQEILGRVSRLPGQSGEDCEAVEASTQVSFEDEMKIPEDPTASGDMDKPPCSQTAERMGSSKILLYPYLLIRVVIPLHVVG